MRRLSQPMSAALRVVAASVIGVAFVPIAPGVGVGAGSGPRTVNVSPRSGNANETFEASGSGCRDAVVTYRIDAGTQNPPIDVGPSGVWSHTFIFPVAPGPHEFTFQCSSRSTAGAPTTFLGPGELRFNYQPVSVVTISPRPSVPPQSCPPPCTPPADPATPATGPPTFTG